MENEIEECRDRYVMAFSNIYDIPLLYEPEQSVPMRISELANSKEMLEVEKDCLVLQGYPKDMPVSPLVARKTLKL
jgi:hypothetical protein